jgi:hypothetical protein
LEYADYMRILRFFIRPSFASILRFAANPWHIHLTNFIVLKASVMDPRSLRDPVTFTLKSFPIASKIGVTLLLI